MRTVMEISRRSHRSLRRGMEALEWAKKGPATESLQGSTHFSALPSLTVLQLEEHLEKNVESIECETIE